MRLILAAMCGLFVAGAAQAQITCGAPITEVDAALAKDHGEVLLGNMLSKSGYMIRIYVNPKTGSYTVFAVRPDGCFAEVDSGMGFEPGKEALPFPDQAPTLEGVR